MKKTNAATKELLIWIGLFIVPLFIYPWALSSTWISNSDVHALLEFWAAAVALSAAGIVLIHFFATGRRFFLLISLGFTLQGTEDLFHAIYSFTRIWPAERIGMADFIPGTYVAGRLILITCLFIALYVEKTSSIAGNRRKEAIAYNAIGFLLAAIATIIIINSPLPRFILPGHIISRPVDFVAALIYLSAFFFFVRVYQNRDHRTPFMWSMIASIIFGCVTQIYMVHSQQLYDAQFDLSHLMKIVSYIFPIFGIVVGTFTMYRKEELISRELSISMKREKDTAEELKRENSERRKAEAELREASDMKEMMINTIPLAMDIVDEEGTVLFMNRVMESTLGGKEGIGRKCWKIYRDDKEQCTDCPLIKGVPRGGTNVLEVSGVFGGKTFHVFHTGMFYQGKSAIMEMFHDVTERKQAEEELKTLSETLQQRVTELKSSRTAALNMAQDIEEARGELEQVLKQLRESQAQLIQSEKMGALGTMVAGVAHELNNPMMGILNFIQYCRKHTPEDDRKYSVLQDAEHETGRCMDIVQNLLTFSRMEKEGEEGRQKESCAAIFDRIFKLLSYRVGLERVTVNRHTAEGTPAIWIKVNSIQQVFFNLISNALDALKDSEKKEIHVTICRKGEFVQVTIADTGCGIAPEDIQRIYAPFYTTKPTGKGTGLGLSVCHGIIQAHGGEITCESRPGEGTTFTILLPIEKRKEGETGNR